MLFYCCCCCCFGLLPGLFGFDFRFFFFFLFSIPCFLPPQAGMLILVGGGSQEMNSVKFFKFIHTPNETSEKGRPQNTDAQYGSRHFRWMKMKQSLEMFTKKK